MIDKLTISNPRDNPSLSVILVIGDERKRAEQALDRLLDQEEIARIEILLFDLAKNDTSELKGFDHPAVRYYRWNTPLYFHEARAKGVQLSRAPIVAFIEEHCLTFENWAHALIRSFDINPWAGIGYEMHNGNPGSGISDATFMMNYIAWSSPVRRGESELIPGHNSAYRREVLLSYEDNLEDMLLNDIVMQRRLRSDGYTLGMEPDARVAHINEASLSLMGRGYYYFNRCLAASRTTVLGMPTWRKYFFLASALFRPWLRYCDNLVIVVRYRPRETWSFLAYAPVIIASYHYCVAGLLIGYLFGAGDAPGKITDHELTVERPLRTPSSR